jgi:hypothetical protein
MELLLTCEEATVLMEILEENHHQLVREISRAKHREFKLALKKREELLESIVAKLKATQTQEEMLRVA